MRNRNLVLGSVAGMALAGALFAAPCFAQSLPRYSTADEQAQTDRLNAQQASEPGIIVSAPLPAPGTPSAADIANYNAAVADANAKAQAQYDAQLKDYQDKTNVYEAQKQGYQQQLDSYRDRAVTYDDHAAVYDRDSNALDATVAPQEEHQALLFPGGERPLVSLDDIANPDRELGGAPVEDRAGNRVGEFRYLTYQDGGREKAVIRLHNNKSVALDDVHLRFDPEHETVIADLSFDELNSMPARF